MPLIEIMGADDEKQFPREKLSSFLEILSSPDLRDTHSYADVQEIIGNVSLKLREKVLKKLDLVNEWTILKLNPNA